jgi:hypothetical protein
VSATKTTLAVLPDRYPAEGKTIGIEIMGNIQADGDDRYWDTEVENLRQQFDRRVRSQVEERKIEHLSVFGLAPIPLLVEFGRLLGDITPADIYQLHREPPGWSWAENGDRLNLLVDHPERMAGSVALKLGVSAAISDDRIRRAIGDDVAIWSVSAAKPGNDVMRHKEDLQDWRRTIRSVNAEIKASASPSPGRVVHVFPAIPVSAAIELGRVRMPKADLPMIIYDEVQGRGFVPRLKIE